MDLLKELAREETACEAAGELGAIEPLMALLTASTARNDMGLQVTVQRPIPALIASRFAHVRFLRQVFISILCALSF